MRGRRQPPIAVPIACWLFVFASGAAQSVLAAQTGGSPRLHFDFESVEGATVRDASGSNHNGTLEGKDGELPQIIDTPYGKALKLEKDRGQGVRVQFADDLVCAEGLTVMAWAKPDNARSHLAIVANKGDRVAGQPAHGYRLSVFWNRALMDLGFGDEDGERLTSAEWSVSNGHWVHVAMTFDGQDMVLYLNATEAARKALPEPRKLTPNRRTFTLGKYFWNDAYPFVGLIGDVRLYDRALTEDEVFAAACEFLSK
jgi:hypothetical protein